jgi:hypothetical protein
MWQWLCGSVAVDTLSLANAQWQCDREKASNGVIWLVIDQMAGTFVKMW